MKNKKGPITHLNFINGSWVPSASGKTRPNINPANTREVLGHAQESTREDTQKAVAAARSAFKGWRKTPAPRRGEVLAKAARVIEARREDMVRAMSLEEGKCPSEARGEVQRALNIVEFMAAEGRRMNGDLIPSELADNVAFTRREPLGVCALITPWNFPIAIPAWKTATALVFGNTVVLKPASLTPWCAQLLVECFQEAGLPDGVLNLVTGPGSAVGDTLVQHPDVAAISFTGSNEVGTRIARLAGERMAKVQLEMGGKNALIVLADADLDLAVNASVLGAFGSTGQRCTATSRVVVERPVAKPFLDKLVAATRKLQVGPRPDPEKYIGPAVDEKQFKTDLEYIEIGKKEGAELVLGGEPANDGPQASGYFVKPTIFTKVKPGSRLAQEEVFGPVLSIIEARDFDDAMAIANDSRFGLASSIFTSDVNRIFRYIDDIEVGIVHINSATIGGEAHVPFGGSKGTGFGGREQGRTAVDFFTEWKSVYVDYTGQSRRSNVY